MGYPGLVQPQAPPQPVPLAQVQPWWKSQPGLTPQEGQALHEGRLPEGFSTDALEKGKRWGGAGIVVLLLGVALLGYGGVLGLPAYANHDGEQLGRALMVGVFGIPALIVGISLLRNSRATPGRVEQAQVLCLVGTLRRKITVVPRGGSLVIKEIGFELDVDGVELKLARSGQPLFEQLREGARYRVYHLGPPVPLVLWMDEA